MYIRSYKVEVISGMQQLMCAVEFVAKVIFSQEIKEMFKVNN